MAIIYPQPTAVNKKVALRGLVLDLLFILVLLLGAYLRFNGLDWGEYSFMHPDERFLLGVGGAIEPVDRLSQYFDTANSSLNPHNRGHGFYVYGTLPLFMARYLVEWTYGYSGYIEMTDIGRPLSAFIDLLTVVLVYAIGRRLYDRRVALLSSTLLAFAVLHIQQSHFFTMDTFITFFTTLAIYFAVRVLKVRPGLIPQTVFKNEPAPIESEQSHAPEGVRLQSFAPFADRSPGIPGWLKQFVTDPLFWISIGFGAALGMAVASKLNAAPVAFMLPFAAVIYVLGLPPEERSQRAYEVFGFLVMAAVVSILTFRIFQPYAFSGPGFFGLMPNPSWVANIREQRIQAGGDIDFPPALQWARRPFWFSLQNMVLWGMGLPFGILAWAGFLWAGWRILKGEWGKHLLLWGWTAFYFIWQSLQFNPTMRYQLPIYPTLAIFAGWAIIALYDLGRRPANARIQPNPLWSRILAVIVGASVLGTTFAWAFAFSRIYVNPFTRVEASRWIYQNIPGPINLHINSGEEIHNQIVGFPYSYHLRPNQPFYASFTPQVEGELREVYVAHIIDEVASGQLSTLFLTVSALPGGEQPLAYSYLSFSGQGTQSFQLEQPVLLTEQGEYYLTLQTLNLPVDLCGPMRVQIDTGAGVYEQQLPSLQQCIIDVQEAYSTSFTAHRSGVLTEINVFAIQESTPSSLTKTVEVAVFQVGQTQPIAKASLSGTFNPEEDSTAGGYTFLLDRPVELTTDNRFELVISVTEGVGALQLYGTAIANEGDWDDGLPLRIDTYDGYGGIYQPDLGFNMYWDDNPEKLERFLRIMNVSEYITISSSRQWGSLPRIPERFPMTTAYYQNLLGCPLERSIEWCYNVAQPGMFQGALGFELVKVFEADISLGPLQINTQPSEEAFTVYDHPKVFIFRKTDTYDPQQARDILGAVDFDKVIHITPKKAGSNPADLMLPTQRLVEQQQGGTWSEIFDYDALQNRLQPVGVVVWYLALAVLGLVVYPLVRLALPGLPDRGYPLARMTGLLLLAYLAWLAGSVRIPFTRTTITIAFLLLVLVGALLAYLQRADLAREWRTRRRYYLLIEGLMLAFFVFALLVRLGNPDLWHPWKGGEKPMDFAYFNAVLKSTSFPPYDPWFAGGYLNYYYYGFVLVGVFTKWLGIVPSFAYNLILPSVFMLIAMGAFSAAWNLNAHRGHAANHAIPKWSLLTGLISAGLMVVLGNLGTVRMLLQGYQRMVAPGGVIEGADILTRTGWTLQGLLSSFSGARMPYPLADWYWIPSRVMPPEDNAITEFPYFTFLYGDPHAHLFALPVALLALSFAVSVVLARGRWRGIIGKAFGFILGGLMIGALYPINLSDIYTYLPLGLVAVGYTAWRFFDYKGAAWLPTLPIFTKRALVTFAGAALLAGLTLLFYQPYSAWYAQGYSSVEVWKGIRTPSTSYLVHWGLFLFVIATWLAWETREWMANTPLSALRRLAPYKGLIQGSAILLVAIIAAFLILKVYIIWIVLPLAAWAGVLLLRPRLPEPKRIALFLIGTGLLITLMVELVAVRGDIGRMNTVFKFYLQVWTLLSVASAAAVGWMMASFSRWSFRWRFAWQVPFYLLVGAAALFTLLATTARVRDRMVQNVPLTLDGMAYMQYAHYYDNLGTEMDLNQDYFGIRWMQENVAGSPVIVEAASPNQYFWFARYANYTGLPTVLGWQWHQMQQRTVLPGHWIPNRLSDVDNFYLTANIDNAVNFLEKYAVQYIIVGQVERGYYPGFGIDKFEQMDGQLWNEVYRDRDTVIYKVLQ